MQDDKSSSPPCGIYLHIADYGDKARLLKMLREVALVINRDTTYEKNMHMVVFDHDEGQWSAMRELIEAVRMAGLVAVVRGKNIDIEDLGPDGVLLEAAEDIEKQRALLGEDAIIGVDARKMAADDFKPLMAADMDFVVLKADPVLISKWTMGSDILCVAGGDLDNETCGDMAIAGASFVDVSRYVRGYKKGVMQAAVNVLFALGESSGTKPRVN